MGNHTPRPWKVDPNFIHDIQTLDGDLEIATVYSKYSPEIIKNNACAPSGSEADANARLIAAAPEMLEVLIELQESAQYWSEYGAPFNIVNRLNAVISKAKGEE